MNASPLGDDASRAPSRRTILTAGLSLTAATLLTVAGCSGEENPPGTTGDLSKLSDGAMSGFKAGQQFTATKDLTFTMLFPEWPEVPIRKDWLLWKELSRRTRVTIDRTEVPLSDYASKRSLLVSAGDAPMLVPLTYPGEESPFTSSGAVLPVSDYLDLMPNFKARVKEWKLESELDRMRQEDGRFYLLPGVYQDPHPDFTLTLRMDVFEQEGIPVPRTWADVRSALERLKDRYPKLHPFSDLWQGNATLNFAASAFGTGAGWGLGTGAVFDPAAGAFVYGPITRQYKELVTYFHGLVADGLMDPESFTQEDEQAERKFVSGKSLVTSGNTETIPVWQRSMEQTLGKGKFKIAKIPVPAGPAGPLMGGGRLWHGFMISAQAKESPNFVAMLQFIDWLWYDMATKEFLKWGVEGTTYTRVAAGKRTLAGDVDFQGMNPAGRKDLEKDFGFSLNQFADGGTTDLVRSTMSPQEVEFQKGMLTSRKVEPENPPAPLTDVEREQATLLTTPLTDAVTSNTLRFILGRRPMSEWDAYVGELKSKGVDQYLELMNSAHKRFQDKHG